MGNNSRENVYGVTLLFANMVLEEDYSIIEKIKRDYMMKFDIVNDFGNERYNEGRAEGKAEGKAEGILEMIKSMLTNGAAKEFVAKTSGFSIQEIEKISATL